MARTVEWKLVVDETGAIKRMEEVGKQAEKVDKGFQKTKKSSKEAERSIKNLGGAFGGLKGAMGMAFGGLGILGAGYGLESVISKTGELSHEVEHFHAVTGMGAQSSLYYVAALKARGLSNEAVTRGYKTLSKAVQTAERQQYTYAVTSEKARQKGRLNTAQLGVQAEAFAQLGISINTLKSLAPEKQFQLITEKLEKLPAGLEKTRLAAQLFGRGGTALLPVLEKGGMSLNHYRIMAERFFPTLKGGNNVMTELIEKQAEGKMAWEGLEFTLGTEVAPALITAIGAFSSLVSEVERGKGPLGALAHVFKDVAHGIQKVDEVLGIAKGGKHGSASGLSKIETVFGAYLGYKGVKKGLGALGSKAGKSILEKIFGSAAGEGAAGAGGANLLSKFGMLRGAGEVGLAAAAIYGGAKVEEKIIGGKVTELLGGKQPGEAGKEGEVFLHRKRAGHTNTDLTALLVQLIQELRAQGHSAGQIKAELHMDSTKVGEVIARNPKAMRFLAEGVERNGHFRNARR